MNTITPDYYKKFKCIADKCKHSCCIGWEIDIDDITLEKYNNFNDDFITKLKSNIEFAEPPHFKLDKKERCPFLNNNGLCDIIIHLGEDMLCQICRDHPRFRNFYFDYVEMGIGLCCEAAAEIILKKADKTTLDIMSEISKIPIVNFREKLFNILQDRSFPIDVRVNNMLAMIDAHLPDNIDWYSVFYHLERLDGSWENYLSRIKNGIETLPCDNSLDTAYEQLLVYLIFRHFSDCQYDGKVKERVLFAVLIYKVIKTMNISNTLNELIEISRVFSCEIEYSDENINNLLIALEE